MPRLPGKELSKLHPDEVPADIAESLKKVSADFIEKRLYPSDLKDDNLLYDHVTNRIFPIDFGDTYLNMDPLQERYLKERILNLSHCLEHYRINRAWPWE